MKTSKRMIFQPAYASSGLRWPKSILPAQGARWDPPRTGPLTHTHVHSDCTSLGCGRRPECPKKTHTETERTSKLHTDDGPGWGSICFLINIITRHWIKWRYSRTCCKWFRTVIQTSETPTGLGKSNYPIGYLNIKRKNVFFIIMKTMHEKGLNFFSDSSFPSKSSLYI